MSVKDSPAGNSGPVTAQAEAVLREAHALATALDRAKTTRRILLVVVLVFVLAIGGIITWKGTSLYARVTSDPFLDEVRSTATQRLEKNKDAYTRHLRTLVDNVRPDVEKVITERFKKDSPAYMQAMQAESDHFARNLQEQLRAKLEDFHKKAVERNMGLVVKEFPAAQDPKVQERLVANIQVAIEALADKYYVDEMRRTMENLYQSWGKIPPAPEPGKGADPIEDQLLATLMELLSIRLTKAGGS